MDVELLAKENAELKETVARYEKDLEEQKGLISRLKEMVRLLRFLHFGPKSEKRTAVDTRNGVLFNEAEDEAFRQGEKQESSDEQTQAIPVRSPTRKGRENAGRKAIDESLPREEVEYDIPEEEKVCACGTEKTCIGFDVSERVRIIPASITVIREKRKKYCCKSCEGLLSGESGVVRAEGKRHLVAGSIADESLLAWSITEKFEFALPFYRQERRLEYIGIHIPRATLSGLAILSAEKCGPLYEGLKAHVRSGKLLNADETRLQVLKEPGRKAQDLSWMWVFRGGLPESPAVVFEYSTGRSSDVPVKFLRGYSGWLQTDDYEAYHTALARLRPPPDPGGGIRHVLCWAHVRRYFVRVWETTRSEDAKKAIDTIGDLFQLEDLRGKYSSQGFHKHRKREAESIFRELKPWMQSLYAEVPPKGLLGKALMYTLDNWELLVRYVDDPVLSPSNNAAENAIRPFVVGRKNWLFADTPAGAESSAVLYSLIESAKLNRHKPYDYLLHVFENLPYTKSREDFLALLPFNVSPEKIALRDDGKNNQENAIW